MHENAFHSNGRLLTIDDYLEVLLAISFPQTTFEPVQVSKVRREGIFGLQVYDEIPGSIFDSKTYLYLRKLGRIHD